MAKRIVSYTILGILIIIFFINVFKEDDRPIIEEEYVIKAATENVQIEEGISEGAIPPDFELKTLYGETIRLSELNGKKVILNFWATWCPPCKAEMPHMESFYEKRAEEENLEIIAVNLTYEEQGGHVLKKIEDFAQNYRLTFPIPLDEDGEVAKRYQIMAIPTTYFIGTNGLVEKKIMGPMDEKMINETIAEMK